MNKEFLYACQQMLEGGGSGEWQNVPVAKLSLETWFIAPNWWQIGWGQGGLWSAPFGRDLIIFTTWSTIWLYFDYIIRVQVASPQKGRRGHVHTEEAELVFTTAFLKQTLSLVGVRAQARLLHGRLEVIGPGAAAAGRRNPALQMERTFANQRRADTLCRNQGKSILRRGQFIID